MNNRIQIIWPGNKIDTAGLFYRFYNNKFIPLIIFLLLSVIGFNEVNNQKMMDLHEEIKLAGIEGRNVNMQITPGLEADSAFYAFYVPMNIKVN